MPRQIPYAANCLIILLPDPPLEFFMDVHLNNTLDARQMPYQMPLAVTLDSLQMSARFLSKYPAICLIRCPIRCHMCTSCPIRLSLDAPLDSPANILLYTSLDALIDPYVHQLSHQTFTRCPARLLSKYPAIYLIGCPDRSICALAVPLDFHEMPCQIYQQMSSQIFHQIPYSMPYQIH